MEMQIGSRIRRLRRLQGRTLEEIARAAGFTRSLLSKIETNSTIPPVATLSRIAESLGVSASILLSESHGSGTMFIPAEKQQETMVTSKGYSFHAFAAGHAGKLMQPFVFTAKKGKVGSGALSHSGEEFVYVLSGKMKYRVANIEYLLGPGDALYFDSVNDHDLTPVTNEVKYLAVFAEGTSAGKGGGRNAGK